MEHRTGNASNLGTTPIESPKVRIRGSRGVAGGRQVPIVLGVIVLAVAAVVAANLNTSDPVAVVDPTASAQAGAVGGPESPEATFADAATPSTIPTPLEEPTEAATPDAATPEATKDATDKPKPTKRPDRPIVTDKPDIPPPTWTPPPTFQGSVEIEDRCLDVNGDEQIMVKASWNSPVPITAVEHYLDGHSMGSHGLPDGDHEAWIAVSAPVPVGTTHVGMAKFYSGDMTLMATIESAPFTAEAGAPCPTG